MTTSRANEKRGVSNGSNRDKSLEMAVAQIEKQFGRGSIMKLGENPQVSVDVIPTGSLGLDLALGIGGLPKGRIVEIYGPESSGKTSLCLHVVAEAQKVGGIAAFIDAEHALDVGYARNLGVNVDELLVSQPDTGDQGLEIADMLVRSGAVDVIVVDSVAALVPKAEIEGEMGDTHVGLQARLMSQALRKLAGNVARSNTLIIFINQLREKIGVMFGCFSYGTRVTLADGTQERIGQIVTQQKPVEVLSYNFETDRVEPRKVVSWFRNGKTDHFLQFTALKPSGNGKAQFAATPNHQIRTPNGWVEAKDLNVGDRVLMAVERRFSDFQWQVIRGGLMGDSALSRKVRNPEAILSGVRYRMGHGPQQSAYLEWKTSLFANIPMSRSVDEKGNVFADFTPLPELNELRTEVYGPQFLRAEEDDVLKPNSRRKKNFSWDYLKQLTPLSLAIWYMDDGHLDIRNESGTSGRIQICIQAMAPETRERVVQYLRDTWDLDVWDTSIRGKSILVFSKQAAEEFQRLIAPYVHPSMDYKLLPQFRVQFNLEPSFDEMEYVLAPTALVKADKKPLTQSMQRFDIEVEGSHNYFVDGVMVHNSPETTPGGRALKFYASVRLDIRKIENLKEGAEVVGSRVRVKVVKSKVSAPFRQTEFDVMYGHGISKEGSLLDTAVDHAIVSKSGAWYLYEGDQIGQGRENTKAFLAEHPDVYGEIEIKVKNALGFEGTAEEASAEEGEAIESQEENGKVPT
jgi:recombination protein RecA